MAKQKDRRCSVQYPRPLLETAIVPLQNEPLTW